MRPKRYFDLMCQADKADKVEYDGNASEIDLVVVEYPGTMQETPPPLILARFLCEICGHRETMPVSTSDCLELQQYGSVPQIIEMPPKECTPVLTDDDMVSMINYLNTDAELTAPSIL